MVKNQKKKAGGPWECYHINNYFGWEAERVVAVTTGWNLMEMITRAQTRLSVILVGRDGYAETKEYFQQAADLGLVEMVHLSGEKISCMPRCCTS